MRRHHALLAAASLAAAAFVACTLNPQPLPPGDEDDENGAGAALDASFASDGSKADPTPPSPDAGVEQNVDGGDASADGDAALDASTDAPLDAPDAD